MSKNDEGLKKMTIHEVLQNFFNLDLSNVIIRTNKDVGSLWISTDEKQLNDKIHIRLTDELTVMRLYVRRNDVDYKIAYVEESDDIHFHTMKSGGMDFSQFIIHGIMNLKSEEEFFQHSLLNDTSDLDYDDCIKLQTLFAQMVVLAHEKLA